MKRIGIALIGLLGLFMLSCRPNNMVWSGTHAFPSAVWAGDDVVVFEPDTLSLEDRIPHLAIFSLRYGEDLSVKDLPFVMETSNSKTGRFVNDTIRPSLIEPERRTADNGRLGTFEAIDTLKLTYRIEPGFKITIYPAEMDDDIKGIYSLTLELK